MYKELLKLEEEGLIKQFLQYLGILLETSSLKKIWDSFKPFSKKRNVGGGG